MEGLNGFFAYAKGENPLMAKLQAEEEGLQQDMQKILAALEKALEALESASNCEGAPDIRGPAKVRIATSKQYHEKLQVIIEKGKAIMGALEEAKRGQIERQAVLQRELGALQMALQQTTGEPSWMKPGTLDGLRRGARTYAHSV